VPDVDGIDIIQKLGKFCYPGALILICGLGQDYLDAASMMAGSFKLKLTGTLQKPVDTAALRTLLTKHAYSLLREETGFNRKPEVSPDELNTALRNNLVKSAVKMTVSVADSTAVGGEIETYWASDLQYHNHDALSKSAELDPGSHNAYSYFMLRHTRQISCAVTPRSKLKSAFASRRSA
jgi:hypothetical protein